MPPPMTITSHLLLVILSPPKPELRSRCQHSAEWLLGGGPPRHRHSVLSLQLRLPRSSPSAELRPGVVYRPLNGPTAVLRPGTVVPRRSSAPAPSAFHLVQLRLGTDALTSAPPHHPHPPLSSSSSPTLRHFFCNCGTPVRVSVGKVLKMHSLIANTPRF